MLFLFILMLIGCPVVKVISEVIVLINDYEMLVMLIGLSGVQFRE